MRIAVIGSGASAVHFAQTALERGHDVVMVDVGRGKPPAVRPGDSFEELKRNLEDPFAHFLGTRFESLTYPGAGGEYYGFPPDKRYVFENIAEAGVRAEGFAPLLSHAQGGLAETWTAGTYPFRAEEMADFPFAWEDLARGYDTVAERIGISGVEDDMARHFPVHRHLRPALPLDEHSALLLERYAERRDALRAAGVTFGRSRVAVLPADDLGRKGCDLLGRCLTGCPTESLYTPSVTLRALTGNPRFEYLGGRRAVRLRTDGERHVRAVVCARTDGSGTEEVAADHVALGAGTLASSRIFLETWRAATGEARRLSGLMDNRQVLVPFLTWRMIRRRHDPRTYQYHQLAFGFDGFEARDHVHALVTTLKTASIHPIVGSLPLDLRTALAVFRDVHAALGLVNVNFPDGRRSSCWVEPGAAGPDEEAPLVVHYEPPTGERARIGRTLGRVRRALAMLGAFVPPPMVHVRPMGASVHYAGTLPMTREDKPFTTTPDGASRDFHGLSLVDGTTFPFLPAKNLTFTLMANATRIAGRLPG